MHRTRGESPSPEIRASLEFRPLPSSGARRTEEATRATSDHRQCRRDDEFRRANVSYEAQKLHLHDGNILWGSRRRREEELGKDVFVMRNILPVTTIVASTSAAPAFNTSSAPPFFRSSSRTPH